MERRKNFVSLRMKYEGRSASRHFHLLLGAKSDANEKKFTILQSSKVRKNPFFTNHSPLTTNHSFVSEV